MIDHITFTDCLNNVNLIVKLKLPQLPVQVLLQLLQEVQVQSAQQQWHKQHNNTAASAKCIFAFCRAEMSGTLGSFENQNSTRV